MESDPKRVQAGRGAVPGPERAQRLVVIVEDDPALRALLARHLRSADYRVLDAGDAESVIPHLIGESRFDLVITDVHLPNLSGVDLLRLLQAHSPMKPVLLITGDDQDTIARDALAAGAAGYLLKPFQLFELDAAIRQAMHRLELLEQLGEVERHAATRAAIPLEWLDMADERCSAGAGHGRRVARLAGVLAKRAGVEAEIEPLTWAARVHELGRLAAPAVDEAGLPAATLGLLELARVPPTHSALLSGMADWWRAQEPADPNGTPASRLLTVADRIDHEAVARVGAGEFPPTAIMEALEAVISASAPRVGKEIQTLLRECQEVLSAIWILGRGGYPSRSPR